MANTIRIKRRSSGNAGAPTSLENAELAYNEIDDVLYYGKGAGGAGGTATSIEAIGGAGAYLTLSGAQTVSGNKTFTGTTIVPTPTSDTHATTKLYVDGTVANAVANASTTFTVAGDSGTSQAITSSDTFTISGGTGLSSVASNTDTLTLNLDNTTVTAASYGSGSAVATFTVDAQGRLTAASNTTISIASTAVSDFEEATQDVVGGMVSTNTESGIAVTYDDETGKLNFDVDDFTITLGGDLTGNVTVTNLANATLTATIAANSVALGTDTTGDYVGSVTAGTGISVSNTGVEGGAFTVTNEGVTGLTGTANEIAVSGSTGSVTLSLPANVTIPNNLVVTGDLTVQGDTTTLNTATLVVEDKNVVLANVETPTDTTADGAGISVLGATTKTFNWVDATDAWTSSEHLNLLSGKAFYIDGASVLSSTTLGSGVTGSSLTSVGILSSGTWNASVIGEIYGGTGQSSYTTGDIIYSSATNTLTKLAIGTTGQLLKVVAGVPTWSDELDGGSF
jgi:hypothetical protein